MRLISRRIRRDFVESLDGHKDQQAVRAALDAWFAEVRHAQWANMAELRGRYATASVVTNERVVFNIKGNDYRLVVAVNFAARVVYVKWIGSHRDYDRIDVRTVSYGE